MKTRLIRFKVTNFRSIEESDWIETDGNTCLVGTNEAGKTNLLIALWKLNPANDEPIIPLSDFPRHLYSQYKANGHSEDVFIQADIELSTELTTQISNTIGCDFEQARIALVKRKYDGKYQISLPYSKIEVYPAEALKSTIEGFISQLHLYEPYFKEPEGMRNKIDGTLRGLLPADETVDLDRSAIEKVIQGVRSLLIEFGKKQNLPEPFNTKLIPALNKIINSFDGKRIETTHEIRQLILKHLPKFVYYSDYGNLDSEIYLQRVIEDKKRTDLTESARAKARTLDVLFKFVNLSPEEIYELGNDKRVFVKTLNNYNQEVSNVEKKLTDEEIAEWADKKKERGVLLRSAASDLTGSFKKWWQQGNYIFSFDADGSHFRINVADALRPEEIELEGRSRGLQWFFSFFLVFLVETKQEHSNAILLLDEPGLSLHPLAQYDLANFFRKLAENNQLIYTSHSPFLVDMDNLANVKAVYIDNRTGRTKVSDNLRHDQVDAEKSIYPVHAALGLSVSDTLLLGCTPILVEGTSDQLYLSVIKRYLISKGKFMNTREIVFIPTGGVRGVGPVARLVASRDNRLPYILLDSDTKGQEYYRQLLNGLYKSQPETVLKVADFLGAANKAYEIEDLLPPDKLIAIIDRNYRGAKYFDEYYKGGEPIVDQIEKWAKENNIALEDGWKVELARTIVNQFDRVMNSPSAELEQCWERLFQTFAK